MTLLVEETRVHVLQNGKYLEEAEILAEPSRQELRTDYFKIRKVNQATTSGFANMMNSR